MVDVTGTILTIQIKSLPILNHSKYHEHSRQTKSSSTWISLGRHFGHTYLSQSSHTRHIWVTPLIRRHLLLQNLQIVSSSSSLELSSTWNSISRMCFFGALLPYLDEHGCWYAFFYDALTAINKIACSRERCNMNLWYACWN